MERDYWVDFWNTNDILENSDLQLQVGRAINKVPITQEKWNLTLQNIREKLKLNADDTLMDICSGNGLITFAFSKYVKEIVAVDISEKLISQINKANISNVTTIIADIRELAFEENKFSKIIFYFALQHFTEQETLFIFKKINKWLKKGGKCYIGDIPDRDKIWKFFNTEERENAYFNSLENDTPIIGNWFNKSVLGKLASYCGFSKSEIINQNEDMINAHYRFDILLIK